MSSRVNHYQNLKKIYVQGNIFTDIRVPMREIVLSDTKNPMTGKMEKNPPVTVYDTSGVYTDPDKAIDIYKGLDPIRQAWIQKRDDVKQLNAFSSDFCNERLENKKLDAFRFQHKRKPFKAKKGANVSQMHYAKKRYHYP